MSESSNHSGRERSSSLANQGSPPPIPEAPPQDEPKKTKKDSPKKVHAYNKHIERPSGHALENILNRPFRADITITSQH